MNKITITHKTNKIFRLQIGNLLLGRQGTRLNIFLHSFPEIKTIRDEDGYDVDFGMSPDNIVADIINDIISFLKKQDLEYNLDDFVREILSRRNNQVSEFLATKQSLLEIKGDSSTSKMDNDKFTSFCTDNLKISLRDYQYSAALLLIAGKGGFDFSVPGAGKTIITYASYAYQKKLGVYKSLFVIGPSSAYNAWFDEYVTCFGLNPDFQNLSIVDTHECKIYLTASANNHSEITFMNYEKVRLLKNEIIQFLSNDSCLLVIDEAHKVKNPNASTTQAVMEITKSCVGRIVLTGTPMPNGYEDLYTLCQIVSPFNNILPFKYNQLKMMTKANSNNGDIEKLRMSLKPYYSRISKQYLINRKELSPSVSRFVMCSMNEQQEFLYNRLDSFCGKLDNNIDEEYLQYLKKAILIRKMQISANPSLLKSSLLKSMEELSKEYLSIDDKCDETIEKLVSADRRLMSEFSDSRILTIINQFCSGKLVSKKNMQAAELALKLISEGKKVLVWDIFVGNMEVLKLILEQITGEVVEMINGSISVEERQKSIKNFREGNSNILLANPATLAESISLHKSCQNAIYVNMNFNAAQFIQSKDRIHRINMPAGTTATYYYIINHDTVDECVAERLNEKEKRMIHILDAEDIEIGGSEFENASIMSDDDIEIGYNK